MEIHMYPKNTSEVKKALDLVQEKAPISWVLLFGGDRWLHVEAVAIANIDGDFVGLASLALEPDREPEVRGIWVDPAHRRRGIGTDLVRYISQECASRTGKKPLFEYTSIQSQSMAPKLLQKGTIARAYGVGLLELP